MSGAALLVTGATGRLGEATVRLLAERGDRLLLTGRNGARLAELEKSYGEPGLVETLEVDVADPAGAQRAAAEATRRLGGLTGLVHLVGTFSAGPLMLTDITEYDQLLRANFRSAVVATQAVLPHLTEGGRLVYFSSPLVQEPLAALSAYSASKAALMTWMRSMAHEVKRGGVHANAVVLSAADTPEMRWERPSLDLDHTVSAELVARVVGFLTSEASEGMYGSCVPVLGKFEFSSALAGGPPPGIGNQPDRRTAVGKARVLFLVKVPTERQEAFLEAYEKIRFVVAGAVPGHLMDQVCHSATDPDLWLITSEWRDLESFEAWERGQEHRDLVKPMRECFVEAKSLRFVVRAETSAPPTDNTLTTLH